MTFAAEGRRGQLVAGAGLGLAAALIAVTPSLAVKSGGNRGAGRDTRLLVDAAPSPGDGWRCSFSRALLPPLPVDVGDAGPHIAILFAGCGLLIGADHSIPIRVDRLGLSLCALFAAIARQRRDAAITPGCRLQPQAWRACCLFAISV